MRGRRLGLALLGAIVAGVVTVAGACGGGAQKQATGPAQTVATAVASCPAGRPMRVHFFDVGQGLAVLVTLPDGSSVLVDTGDSPKRPGCSLECAEADQRLLAGLTREVPDGAIELLWITHQHSDHIGGAPEVLDRFKVGEYIDNGRDIIKPLVEKVHVAAEAMGARIVTVDPSHADFPFKDVPGVKLTAVVPGHWPEECGTDPNACSIGLRIDYCKSSVLFTGDMPAVEEALVDTRGPATLLQVAHHGSDTSTSAAFLAKVQPKYAVVSAGKPTSPLNLEYCHPRKSTIERLDEALGGSGATTLEVYDGSCKQGTGKWSAVHTNDRLFATERDGDVVLTTNGDGHFRRE